MTTKSTKTAKKQKQFLTIGQDVRGVVDGGRVEGEKGTIDIAISVPRSALGLYPIGAKLRLTIERES